MKKLGRLLHAQLSNDEWVVWKLLDISICVDYTCRNYITIKICQTKPNLAKLFNCMLPEILFSWRNIQSSYVVLTDSLHYARTSSPYLSFSRIFSMPCASFSMLGGPGGIGCNVPVHAFCSSRDVIVVGVFDCVKECMGFVMYLII